MAVFPLIQSPCPYKSNLAQVMDGDFCRMCKRQVVDITAMSDAGRIAFLKGCETEVCVSYRVPARAAAAIAALSVSLGAPLAAAAQQAEAPAPMAATTAVAAETAQPEYMEVVVGGIKTPAEAKMVKVDDPADAATPVLPVAYEDAAPAKDAPSRNDKATSPAAP